MCMRFTYEVELTAFLMRRLSRAFGTSKASIATYVNLPIGDVTPDLVMVTKSNRSLKAIQARLSAFDCWVLSELRRSRPRTTTDLAEALFSTEGQIIASINRLERLHLAAGSTAGHILRVSKSSLNTAVTAIESKLERWREALDQALAYRRFANWVYVAMPLAKALGTSRLLQSCRSTGVGLIGVDRRRTSILVTARWQRLSSPEWFWTISKTIGLEARNLGRR